MENSYWAKPQTSDIDNLAEFLNRLNWPSTPRHLIVFNEPNHASEWGGGVDPKSYADISIYAYQKFKSLNSDFFLLGPSLDLASPENPPSFKSAENYYREIFLYRPEYFNQLDGLSSHSYPNHGFIGSPKDTSLHSIVGYQSELSYLRQLGVSHTYPVFITETGWPHRQGEEADSRFFTAKTSAAYLLEALEIWQSDPAVSAVTPFIYNYPNPPFDHFSWVDKDQNLYPDYQCLVSRPKLQNHVFQKNQYTLDKIQLPFLIFSDKEYFGEIRLKNTGQSIWGETQFCLNPQSTQNVTLEAICSNNAFVYPGQVGTFNFKFKISSGTEFKDKTFISWENLSPFEITPFSGTDRIYHPKTNLWESAKSFFSRLLPG